MHCRHLTAAECWLKSNLGDRAVLSAADHEQLAWQEVEYHVLLEQIGHRATQPGVAEHNDVHGGMSIYTNRQNWSESVQA